MKVLGYPVIFKDFKVDFLLFDQVFDIRQASDVDMDDLEPFTNTVSLRFSFTKKTFAFTYFTLFDLFADLGGVGSGIASILDKYYVYMIMLFAVQLNMLVKTKHR
jgi:hypothetical protein